MKSKQLRIIALPRSGTHWIVRLLREVGVKVGHEKMGRHGTVSSLFLCDDYWRPSHRGDGPENYVFEQTWHQRREPLKTISSIRADLPGAFWQWQERHTGIVPEGDRLIASARLWLAWNYLCERQAPNFGFRVEDVETLWPEMCGRLGLSEGTAFPTQRASGRHEDGYRLSEWDEIKTRDTGLYDEIRRMARRYGYED